MRHFRPALVACLWAAGGVLAQTDGLRAAGLDPCSLGDEADIEAATGLLTAPGEPTETPLGATGASIASCTFALAEPGGFADFFKISYIAVTLFPADGSMSPADWFAGQRGGADSVVSGQKEGKVEDVGGLGDAAFVTSWLVTNQSGLGDPAASASLAADLGGVTELTVLTGDHLVTIHLPVREIGNAKAKELAAQVAERLANQ